MWPLDLLVTKLQEQPNSIGNNTLPPRAQVTNASNDLVRNTDVAVFAIACMGTKCCTGEKPCHTHMTSAVNTLEKNT